MTTALWFASSCDVLLPEKLVSSSVTVKVSRSVWAEKDGSSIALDPMVRGPPPATIRSEGATPVMT